MNRLLDFYLSAMLTSSLIVLSQQVSDAAWRNLPRSQSPIGCKPCDQALLWARTKRSQPGDRMADFGGESMRGFSLGNPKEQPFDRTPTQGHFKARMMRALTPNRGKSQYGSSYTVARERSRTLFPIRAAARFDA